MIDCIEVSFLIPVRGDRALSDERMHSASKWEWLKEQLWHRFGGATLAPGFYEGFYADPDTGDQIADKSRKYVIAVSKDKIVEVREMLMDACILFEQKCIYLSVAGMVEFIQHPDK